MRYLAKIETFADGWKFTIENDATYHFAPNLSGGDRFLDVTVHSFKLRTRDKTFDLNEPLTRKLVDAGSIFERIVNHGSGDLPFRVAPLGDIDGREIHLTRSLLTVTDLGGSEVDVKQGRRIRRTLSLAPFEGDPYVATLDMVLEADGFPIHSDLTIARDQERVTVHLVRMPLLEKTNRKGR